MLRLITIFFMTLGLVGLVSAGWHPASSILPGTFPSGNFIFNGSVQIGSDFATCNTAKEGANRYDSTSNTLQLCDGSNWADIAGDSGAWTGADNISFIGGKVGIRTVNLDNCILTVVGDIKDKDIQLYSYSSVSTTAKGDYDMLRSRGTEASPESVQDDDSLGSIIWNAYDGTTFHPVAEIESYIDGTPGTGDLPTRMVFRLTPDGTTTLTTRMTILNDGNVGIGTETPNDALDVVGDIDATGCIQTDNSGSLGGTCISDARLKENVVPLSGSLNRIAQLRPVSFDWKKDSYNISHEKGSSVGLIAQELEQVFPELVVTGEDGYKKIRYDTELKMHIIEAMKEQQKQIEELKAIACTTHPESTICN